MRKVSTIATANKEAAMPNREFWSGLTAGAAIATIAPHFSYWTGWYAASAGMPFWATATSLTAILVSAVLVIAWLSKAPE